MSARAAPEIAHREIELGGVRLGYRLRRASRRTLGFAIGASGLTVSAPRSVAQAQIDAALQRKTAWILRHLAAQGQRRQAQQAARIEWRDGAELPWLGEPLRIRLAPQLSRTLLQAARPLTQEPATLLLALSADTAPEALRAAVQRWLQRQARALFEARIAVHAAPMGVQIRQLRLSSARTRWGSASSDGSIRLNWRLIHFPVETIDYVVVHELAHLREMNHSPAFWAIVQAAMPDHEQRRRQLRDGVVPVFD
jgi:predicted metal-dependent hydrolase